MLRLVEVLQISDGSIICSDRHDTSGYKLLLSLVFRDSSPTKDGGNGLSGVLVCWALVLAVQLATELLMPERLGESGDGLGVSDVGN